MNTVNSTSQPEEPKHTNATLLPEKNDKFFVEQYRQALENDLHYDRTAWTMGTVLVPVSFGVLAAAIYLFDKLSWPVVAVLGVVATFVLLAWLNMCNKMASLQKDRRISLIEPLEEHFKALNFYSKERPRYKLPISWRIAKCIGVRWTILLLTVLFAIAWIALTIYKVL